MLHFGIECCVFVKIRQCDSNTRTNNTSSIHIQFSAPFFRNPYLRPSSTIIMCVGHTQTSRDIVCNPHQTTLKSNRREKKNEKNFTQRREGARNFGNYEQPTY